MRSISPKTAWITVNRQCNFRCSWCYATGAGFNPSSDMSLEFAIELSTIARDAGVETILLIGGEPTLWPHLFDFNAWCRSQGLRSVLVTNGVRFSDDTFLAGYRKSPNDIIGISVKATTAEQLFGTAGVRGFSQVSLGIQRAIKEFGAHVNITYSSLSAEHLVAMVQTVADWGASSVKIEFCSTTFMDGHPSSEFMVPPVTLVENIVRDYSDIERITDGKIVLDMMVPLCIWPEEFIRMLHKKGRMLSVCHVHKRRGLIFNGDGGVIMCNALFDYPLGKFGQDFVDGDSLLRWLNSPAILKLYDRIGSYPSKACSGCAWYSECGGGCPLKWATYRPDSFVRPMSQPL